MAGIAMIGCGFVADYYISSLKNYPNLQVIGVYDRERERAEKFSKHYRLPLFHSLDDLLSDSRVEIVVNLTNPRDHFSVSKSCLEAGKHVYTEKPLATEQHLAKILYETAKEKKLRIASAPCSILGESAQTLWKAIREGKVGDVRLAYGEIDDGPIFLMEPEKWKSSSGTPWPAKDEYEVGCTFEHAGYYLTWLIAFFGPAEHLQVASHQIVDDKRLDEPLTPSDTPDFSVACIKFQSGTVARLTCSIVAPHDHSLRVIGDKGVLKVDECWHYGEPVTYTPFTPTAFRAAQYRIIRNNPLLRWQFGLSPKKIAFARNPGLKKKFTRNYMDYARGIDELASSIEEQRECRLSPELALHVNEISSAITGNGGENRGFYRLESSCGKMEPMDWAK